MRKANKVVLIVATSQQAGKSTGAHFVAGMLDAPYISTSRIISERVEDRLGLARGSIPAIRAHDAEAYRDELINEGNHMDDLGKPPGVVALERGYRVIEGIRRTNELVQTVAYAQHMYGLRPLVVCIERPGGPPLNDNTQAAGLRQHADELILNDGDFESLRLKIKEVLERHDF